MNKLTAKFVIGKGDIRKDNSIVDSIVIMGEDKKVVDTINLDNGLTVDEVGEHELNMYEDGNSLYISKDLRMVQHFTKCEDGWRNNTVEILESGSMNRDSSDSKAINIEIAKKYPLGVCTAIASYTIRKNMGENNE